MLPLGCDVVTGVPFSRLQIADKEEEGWVSDGRRKGRRKGKVKITVASEI